MPVKKSITQKIKATLSYFFKMVFVVLFWLIAYGGLIIFSNGALQGAVAAVGAAGAAGLTLAACIGKGWILPGFQRYFMIFLCAVYIIFVVHTSIPVATSDRPRTAPDFTDVPTMYWHLRTGSHIAYYKFTAKPAVRKRPEPIIFLHGGPGAYVRKLDLSFFSRFSEDGYDVYLYDQAGAGRSGLLSKREYSHIRNIRDFTAITDIIKAKRYIVIGQSYGGSLLADIASDKKLSQRIYKAIYAEPGVTVPSSAPTVFAKSPNALTEDVNLPVRIIIGMMLNPKGNFTAQNEVVNYMSGRQDLIQKLFLQSFPRNDAGRVPKVEPNVLNFSVIGIIPPEISALNKDLQTRFQHNRVRSMLMLGESSYIERNAPLDLLRINPGIERTQYFKNTGHILWNGLHDNNQRVKAAIDAFLTDSAPVLPDYPKRADIAQFMKSGM